ncbi:hypothetical protein B0J17DRAFT_421283 [Rhizoctonia solani]|nr:hypothetical protein B0J17DRAFT_421283 [Rhizoctonia solani]
MKMVDRATHKIVQLLQMFEEQHGMRFFPRNMLHVIYECGLALLKEAATLPFAAAKKRANALEAGNMCLRALRGTSKTWSWADQLANQLEGQLNEAGANIFQTIFYAPSVFLLSLVSVSLHLYTFGADSYPMSQYNAAFHLQLDRPNRRK